MHAPLDGVLSLDSRSVSGSTSTFARAWRSPVAPLPHCRTVLPQASWASTTTALGSAPASPSATTARSATSSSAPAASPPMSWPSPSGWCQHPPPLPPAGANSRPAPPSLARPHPALVRLCAALHRRRGRRPAARRAAAYHAALGQVRARPMTPMCTIPPPYAAMGPTLSHGQTHVCMTCGTGKGSAVP